MLDRLITGARVFDGRRFLDGYNVGIAGAEIAHLGPELPARLSTTDAEGLILSPAFIDSHSHADFQCLDAANDGHSALSQGVATLVVGNCGFSATPKGPGHPILLPSPGAHALDPEEHRRRLQAALPLDVADLMGHGSLRMSVLGEARVATPREIDRMAGLLEDFLAGGGLGLSVGLNYPEAAGYNEGELLELCRVLARCGRPLTCHIRDQGPGILQAVEEVLDLSRKTGCRVLLSHLRPISNRWDHLVPELLRGIEASDLVAMDLYPYVAGFTSLAWLFQHLFQRLPGRQDLLSADDVAAGTEGICIGGLADVHVLFHRDPGLAGRTITEIAASRGVAAGLAAQEVLLEDPDCLCLYDHESTPQAVDSILSHPKCLIGSDGYLFPASYHRPCHPRSFGAFTGFLVRYVRACRIDAQEGLSKLTFKTAGFFNLRDRGEIRVGQKANLALFSFEDLREEADLAHPSRPSLGMHEVILAGRTVWWKDRVLGDRVGRRACPRSG